MWEIWPGLGTWGALLGKWELHWDLRQEQKLSRWAGGESQCKVNTQVRWTDKCPVQLPATDGFAAPDPGSAGSPFGHGLSCRGMPCPRSCTDRPTLLGHFSSIAPPKAGRGSQTSITAWILPLPSPASAPSLPWVLISRTLLNKQTSWTLNSARVCFLENPNCISTWAGLDEVKY